MDCMYWVGMDTAAETSAQELEEFNRFYSQIHLPEVVAGNPGCTHAARYELALPDPRGDFGPRWLAVYEMDGEAAARTYAERNDGPPEGRPHYTPRPPAWQRAQTRWRMIWRHISTSGTSTAAPTSIFVVGMNVPVDTDAVSFVPASATGLSEILRGLRRRRRRHRGYPGRAEARRESPLVGTANLGTPRADVDAGLPASLTTVLRTEFPQSSASVLEERERRLSFG